VWRHAQRGCGPDSLAVGGQRNLHILLVVHRRLRRGGESLELAVNCVHAVLGRDRPEIRKQSFHFDVRRYSDHPFVVKFLLVSHHRWPVLGGTSP
jgi:hypothetical protein